LDAGQTFNNNGDISGTTVINGHFHSSGVIRGAGDSGASSITVNGDATIAGTHMFYINSLTDLNAISQFTAQSADLKDGMACICIGDEVRPKSGDTVDLLFADISSVFKEVVIGCASCPASSRRSTTATLGCDTRAAYGARSFGVLFGNCVSGGNWDVASTFKNISPPWYVVFPVFIVVLIAVVVIVSIVLLVYERRNKSKFAARTRRQRKNYAAEMLNQSTSSGSASGTASDTISLVNN